VAQQHRHRAEPHALHRRQRCEAQQVGGRVERVPDAVDDRDTDGVAPGDSFGRNSVDDLCEINLGGGQQ